MNFNDINELKRKVIESNVKIMNMKRVLREVKFEDEQMDNLTSYTRDLVNEVLEV